ncbi:MAG: flagellar protein FliS [Parasphingorhabdus sp.]|uniref:flagellar export chaperone FliS n=1 Tax=Parasphingorhabdus sp. TaxID=2709688 RepID=UPI0030039FE0
MYNMSFAQSSYASAGKRARVLNANSHELIAFLFDELINLLDEILVIHKRDKSSAIPDQQAMALTIVDSLMVSLDFEKGGNLAMTLHRLYGQVRELIAAKDADNQIRNNRAAHQMISEIYAAWAEIG